MVCFYAGKPSEYLELPKGSSRYRNDGFEMRRSSENPLIENQSGKKDWGVSNKCVGFNVDIGTRNQGVFYSFSVSQDNGKATSEAINTQIDIVNQASGKNVATQNVGLYNLYKKRSYGCSVVSLGNALLQPMMYFNLKHVPMFNGPYLIQQVEHSIQPGQFQTTFTGVRQGIYDLPAIDSYLQSINQNLLSKVEELLKIKKDTINVLGNTTDAVNATKIPQKSDTTKAAENTCESKVLPVYSGGFGFVSTGATQTNITEKVFADRLKAIMPNLPILQTIIYCISYIESFQKYNNNKSGKFNGWDNNFASISLNYDWGTTSASFVKKYSCVNVRTTPSTNVSLPLANFATLDAYILFMRDRLLPRISQISEIGLLKYYVSYWSQPNVSPGYYDTHTEDFNTLSVTINNSLNSALSEGVKVATKEIVDDLKNTISKVKSEGKSKPNATPTPIEVTPLPGQTCPPPVIRSFSPLSGNTGTIVQLNGVNFNDVTSIKVGNVEVPSTGITIFNDTTLRFNTPQIGTGLVVSKDNIVITSSFGSGTSVDKYTFDPSIVASEAASPGSYQNPEKQTTSDTPNTNNTNTNPQSTGPITLIETENVKGPNGSTTLLTVKVNPEAGAWKIDPQPDVDFILVNVEPGPNNKYIEDVFSRGVGSRIVGYVSPDQQVFSITESQMINEFTLKDYDEDDVRGYFTISLYARPVDRVANPKDVILSYKFNVYLTNKKAGDPVVNEPNKVTSITYLGDVNQISQSGPQYYNIVKGGGGFKSFQLNVPTYNPQDLLNQEIIDDNSFKISATFREGSDTKYSYSCTVDSLGSFKLKITYRVNGVPTTIYGPLFTL